MNQSLTEIGEEVLKILKEEDRFRVVTHVFPDGDGIGSSLATYKLLKNLGKKVQVHIDSTVPYQYQFLPQVQALTEKVLPDLRPRVLIVLDSSDLARIAPCTQEMEEFEYIINVDHHHHNSQFGHLNMVDPGASSTAEILFYLFWERVEIDYDMAVCLYTGLVFDTGRFQYANTTQRSHHMASHLIGLGVDPNYVFRNIYENQPPGVLDLYARALQRAHFHRDTGLIHSYVRLQDLQDHSLSLSASERVIDFLRSVKGVSVAAVFKEYEKGYRVSLRSTGDQDVSKIALSFGGGGHPMAAGFEWHGEMAACLMRLQQEIQRQLKSKRDESQ